MPYINLLLVIIILSCLGCAKTADYEIVEAQSGTPLNLNELSDVLLTYDVIFFGELHDDSLLHHIEHELYKKLIKKNKDLVLSMEMFERDNQTGLDNYIQGKSTYEQFAANVRLWSNHETDYEPLLQLSRKYSRDVIASNVPRKYATLVAKSGEEALNAVEDDERQYFAENLIVLNDRYKEKFYSTMSQMGRHGMPQQGGHDALLNIYKAQCLKDDTMAESINNYLLANPGKKVLHINGDFHSRYHLGSSQKLALLNRDLKIAVIAPVAFQSQGTLQWQPAQSEAGDFLILFYRTEKY
ncbi:MAG: ChaN family lipoprotein [Candidatus Cloacimonadales bacterium]